MKHSKRSLGPLALIALAELRLTDIEVLSLTYYLWQRRSSLDLSQQEYVTNAIRCLKRVNYDFERFFSKNPSHRKTVIEYFVRIHRYSPLDWRRLTANREEFSRWIEERRTNLKNERGLFLAAVAAYVKGLAGKEDIAEITGFTAKNGLVFRPYHSLDYSQFDYIVCLRENIPNDYHPEIGHFWRIRFVITPDKPTAMYAIPVARIYKARLFKVAGNLIAS